MKKDGKLEKSSRLERLEKRKTLWNDFVKSKNFLNFNKRFFSKVKKIESGCHEWTSCINGNGYGRIGIYKKTVMLAHRVAFALDNGYLPEEKIILHICDNPKCVNPDHLEIGDHKENMRQMAERNRSSKMFGEKNPSAKLTLEKVIEIREKYSSGLYTNKSLAEIYNVSKTTIQDVKTGKNTWRLKIER